MATLKITFVFLVIFSLSAAMSTQVNAKSNSMPKLIEKIILWHEEELLTNNEIELFLKAYRKLQNSKKTENFLDVPINKFTFDPIKVVTEDLPFDKLCSVMDRIEHSYVIYKDIVVSPWDICLALIEETQKHGEAKIVSGKTCPHCGKSI